MASFTETAYYSRQFIKFGGLTLVALMVGRMVFGGLINYWKLTHPPKAAPPTMGFGPLPPLDFPKTNLNLSYTLELPTGSYPQTPDRMSVYAKPEVRPNLIALEESKAEAKRLGFTKDPARMSDVLYRWSNPNPLNTTLEMFIYTGLFTYRVDWFSQVDFLNEKLFTTEAATVDQLKNFLQRAQLLADDLDLGETRVTYLKASAGAFRETVSLSEADFVQVDLYRSKLEDQYLALPEDPEKGLVRGIISGNKNVKLVQVEYNYFPVDYTTPETYPIIGPDAAYALLQQGSGFVARIKPGVTSVTLRRIELGYYDSFTPIPYFQPIYIFRGDDNFIGYVPAIATTPNQ